MPKYLVHVSMSALHVWSLTDTFEAPTEEDAHRQAEEYIRNLSQNDLKNFDEGHNDYNVQIEDSKEFILCICGEAKADHEVINAKIGEFGGCKKTGCARFTESREGKPQRKFVPDELICKAVDKGMSPNVVVSFPKKSFEEKIQVIGQYLTKQEIDEVLNKC